MNPFTNFSTLHSLRRLAAILLIGLGSIAAVPPQTNASLNPQLEGCWKLLSYNYAGITQKLSPEEECIKTFTSSKYTWMYYNLTNQKIVASGTGTYLFEGNSYLEKGEIVHQPEADFRSGAYRKCDTRPEQLQEMYLAEKRLQVKIMGNLLSYSGTLVNGTPIEETWQRVN